VDDLAAAIREHTEDWHMLQRVFVDDLEPRTGAHHAGANRTGASATGEGP
jgi:KDO2-lipid IV(A) lauroyltransferase